MASTVTNPEHFNEKALEKGFRSKAVNITLDEQWRIFVISLVIVDVVMMLSAFMIAYLIRFEMNVVLFNLWVTPSFQFYLRLMLVLVPTWLSIFAIKGLYSRENLLGGTKEYSSLFNSITMGMILVIAFGFLVTDFYLARAWLLMAWFFSFILLFFGRFVLRRFVYYLRTRGYFLSPAIIVGANDEGLMIAEQLLQWKTSGFNVLGFVDKKVKPGTTIYRNLKCLGSMDELDSILHEYGVEELILASSAISSRDKMVDIFKLYGFDKGINVRFSSGLYEIVTTGLTVNQFAYVPLVGVNPVRLTGVDRFIKSLMDISITIPGVIVLSPVLMLIALVVKLDSPGPIFHRRRVVGVNGREFDALKFRTMLVNGDEILEQYPELKEELLRNHKLKNDPRITRIGGFLRKFSLDELPQLFNVLKGDMTLVGPRMITKAEMDKYQKWDLNLLTVRPGITGLWQVSGRSNISYEERVRLDMYYIRNWTIWLDIQLLVQTIPAVIKGRGAY